MTVFPRIVLLTDFGTRDGFTAVLHGVIAGIAPDVPVIDGAHNIPPQDIRHAGWVLDQCWEAFPAGTVFVCVVDPNVGNPAQASLLVWDAAAQKGILAPDNGLMSRLLSRLTGLSVQRITQADYFYRNPPSQTFHGRDVYAPVAAHLANAIKTGTVDRFANKMGPTLSVDCFLRLALPQPEQLSDGTIQGHWDIIDTYGNLLTNIPAEWAVPWPHRRLTLETNGDRLNVHFRPFYGFESEIVSDLFFVPGSHGKLELCAQGHRAETLLAVIPAQSFTVELVFNTQH